MSKETLDFVPPLPPKNYKISSAFSYNFISALTAKKLEAGEITREEYDHWRYTYPAVEAQRTRDRLDALRAKQKAAETDE